jgi:hypothetical protein
MNKNLLMAETPQVGAKAQLNEGMSVVPSNKSGRIHRLGFIEIIDDDTEKVEVDTEGMTPEELDALRIWEIEKAADEGRLRIHEIVLTDEEAAKLGIRFLEPYHRIEMIQNRFSLHDEPGVTNKNKDWRSLRPASRPNKNKGETNYSFF